jgi:hypothetical protein
VARKKKFGARDRLAEIISEAERMWVRLVIKPSNAEEVLQESASSSKESAKERDEDATTPQDEAFTEDIMEKHTPRTPSTERPGTLPPPNNDCETEHATPSESYTAPDLTKVVHTGIPERVSTEEPEIPLQTGVKNRPGSNLEVGGTNQYEGAQNLEVPSERSRVNTEAITSEATQHPKAPDGNRANTEANIFEPTPNESEATPNTEAAPPVGPSSSSRFNTAFEVLGRGLLGHPMEAIKSLIPEGFLGNVGTSSPEKIAQGILISHYRVSFQTRPLFEPNLSTLF